MRVVVAESGRYPVIIDVENDFKAFRAIVGGYAEGVRMGKFYLLYNKDGLSLNLPVNRVFGMTRIVGPLIVTRVMGNDFTDLTDEGAIEAMLLVSNALPWSQQIAKGTLLDVTGLARKIGFTVPVAITPAAYRKVITLSAREYGHISAILAGLHQAVVLTPGSKVLRFGVLVSVDGEESAVPINLDGVIGRDDNGGTCLTVQLTGKN